jgi:serine phosphatase RsbU (regulator of sigma subunit)
MALRSARASKANGGVERLEQTVIAHRDEDAARLVASVLAAVDGFAGKKPRVDDATIVVMKAIE